MDPANSTCISIAPSSLVSQDLKTSATTNTTETGQINQKEKPSSNWSIYSFLSAGASFIKRITAGIPSFSSIGSTFSSIGSTLKQAGWSAYNSITSSTSSLIKRIFSPRSTDTSSIKKKYGEEMASTYQEAFLNHGKVKTKTTQEIKTDFEKLPPQDQTVTILSNEITSLSDMGYMTDEMSPQQTNALLPSGGFARIYGNVERTALLDSLLYEPTSKRNTIASFLDRAKSAVTLATNASLAANDSTKEEMNNKLTQAQKSLSNLQNATEGYESWSSDRLAAFVAMHNLLDSVSAEGVAKSKNSLEGNIALLKSYTKGEEDNKSLIDNQKSLVQAQQELDAEKEALKQAQQNSSSSQDDLIKAQQAVKTATDSLHSLQQKLTDDCANKNSLRSCYIKDLITAQKRLENHEALLEQAEKDPSIFSQSQLGIRRDVVADARAMLAKIQTKTPDTLKHENQASIAAQQKLLDEVGSRAQRILSDTKDYQTWSSATTLAYVHKETTQDRLSLIKFDRVCIKINDSLVPCSSQKSTQENVKLFKEALEKLAGKKLSDEEVEKMIFLVDSEKLSQGFPSGDDLRTGMILGSTQPYPYETNIFEITLSQEGAFDFHYDSGRSYLTSLQTPIPPNRFQRVSVILNGDEYLLGSYPTKDERQAFFKPRLEKAGISDDRIINNILDQLEKLDPKNLTTTNQALQSILTDLGVSLEIKPNLFPISTVTSSLTMDLDGNPINFNTPSKTPKNLRYFVTQKQFTYRYTPSSGSEVASSIQITDSRQAYWPFPLS